MLVAIALVTLLAFAGGGVLAATGAASPVVAAHVPFAIGIVPLIIAAISHFIPVLTRTRAPHAVILALPFVAQLAGGLAVLAMHGVLPRSALHAAASIDLVAAIVLAVWARSRARASLGQPHPGWRWYPAAMVMLAAALLSVLATAAWPDAYLALRNLHLHLNTLGLIGLAAFGTLPVLLPTALGRPEPAAATWLTKNLKLFAAGALAVALAAGLAVTALSTLTVPLAVLGAVLLTVPAGALFSQWRRQFGWTALLGDGAAVVLCTALAGWLCLVATALLHAPLGAFRGLGGLSGQGAVAAYAGLFLMPLVTGAMTQLLPVWRHPGPMSAARQQMRIALARAGRLRAGLFLAGGLALLAGFPLPGAAAVLLALLLFLVAFVRGTLAAR